MYIKAALLANFLLHNCQHSQEQVHLVQSPSSSPQVSFSVRYTQVVMQALQMRFVRVVLFSSDDECLMGLSVVKSHGSLNLSTLRWLLAKSDAWPVLQETK